MTNTETSSSQNGLTDQQVQESTKESTDPVGNNDLPEGAKNVQHAIQLAREREEAAKKEAEAIRAELQAIKDREKQAKRAEMSELERYKEQVAESETKAAKLELGMLVRDTISGKNLPKGVEQILIKNPWAIPAVTEEIDSGTIENSWTDIIASVKRHLPDYVNSLVVEPEKPLEDEEPSSRRVDSERSMDSSVVKKHVYTKEEIARLGKDPVEWAKHEEAIKKQIAESGGRIL